MGGEGSWKLEGERMGARGSEKVSLFDVFVFFRFPNLSRTPESGRESFWNGVCVFHDSYTNDVVSPYSVHRI